MMLKKVLAAFFALALLFISSSCDGQNVDINAPNTNQQEGQINTKSKSLTAYVINDKAVKKAVEVFNSKDNGVIEAKFFNLTELENKLEPELISGFGSDVIVASYFDLPHLYKLVKNGSFVNLDEYIKNDKDYDSNKYRQQILDYGIFNGSRYVMPLSYGINDVLFTTQQIIDEYQFTLSDSFIPITEFVNLSNMFKEKTKNEGKYLLHSYSYLGNVYDFSCYSINLDSNTVKQTFEKYREICSSVFYEPGQGYVNDSEFYSLLADKKVVFKNRGIISFDFLPEAYRGCSPDFIPEIYAITYRNDEIAAYPLLVAAINTNCTNKESAYEFINILLSEEIQTDIFLGLPVNNIAFYNKKRAFIENPNESDYIEINTEQAELLADKATKVINGNIAVNLTDYTIDRIMDSEAVDVYNGTKTVDEAVQSMQARIKDYLEGDISEYVKPSETPSPGAPAVSIWYMDTFADTMNAVKAFNEKRKDVRIEETVYSSNSREEFINKLTTSIMSGEGPDIIHYDRHIFNSLRKTASTGVFCNLDELIAKDATFKSLDLNYEVLEAGVFNGKRYAIPLRYELPLLMSTKGILDQNGIDIDESNWTMPEFRKKVMDYTGRTRSDYFINYLFMFKYLVGGCGVDFIDYETKTANFESKEFIDLMKYYKEIYPHITPVEIDMSYDLPERMIQNNTITMYFDFISSPEKLWAYNSTYHGVLGEEPVIYPIPTMARGQDIPVFFTHAVSINQSCGNKGAAMDFIEELLSESIQGATDDYGNSNITIGFPVNKKALLKDLETYKDASASGKAFSGGFSSVSLSEELAGRIIELTDKVCAGPEIDLEVYRIISEGMKNYLEGKQTAEQAAREINNKVNLFLNE